jgi:hypothetical protein
MIGRLEALHQVVSAHEILLLIPVVHWGLDELQLRADLERGLSTHLLVLVVGLAVLDGHSLLVNPDAALVLVLIENVGFLLPLPLIVGLGLPVNEDAF